MNPEELFRVQIRLEGLRFNDDGHLERWKDMPGGETGPPARVVVVDYGYAQYVYFGNGIDPRAERLIHDLPPQAILEGDREVFDVLNRQKKVEGQATYCTYTASPTAEIPASPMIQRLSSMDERLRGFGDGFYCIDYDDVFAAIVKGSVASAAVSSREDGTAAEAWVHTRPEHRRQGLATQAAAAWLRSVTQRGLTPFYSHENENEASRRLAESLPLQPCFELTCYP